MTERTTTDHTMSEEARRDIFVRIRRATRGLDAAAVRAERDALPAAPAATLKDDDLAVAFLARVLQNGGSAAVAADRRGAVDAIGKFVAARHGQRRVVAGQDQRLAALPWRDGGLLPRFGAAEPGDAVAISYGRHGVAETGSVMLWLDGDNPACNNLLTEDHVVLVDAKTLVPRLEGIWASETLADPDRRPRGAMLISGPSSTGDIALKMVMGAHGPRCWHVVLLGAELKPDTLERARALAAKRP